VVVENGVIQHINGHAPGQFSEAIAHPNLAIAVILSGKRIESEQVASLDEPIPTMIDTDLVGIEDLGPWFGGHGGIS
jgi:hypothetical protein